MKADAPLMRVHRWMVNGAAWCSLKESGAVVSPPLPTPLLSPPFLSPTKLPHPTLCASDLFAVLFVLARRQIE